MASSGTRRCEQHLRIVLGLLRLLRLALPAAVQHPQRPGLVTAGGRRLTQQTGQVRPVVVLGASCPALLLTELEVAGRVSGAMPVCWQYAAISMATQSIVSAASVARYSVIRFQSRAAPPSTRPRRRGG
ncbi:hypothetical protein AB0D57_17500 [Streptomyces sp. NPDC048275]|uniref:hypothetical protein n=1 Tax=Streptomyces sp. NPDC048275 TaxID=3155629 RepID=UPI0033FB4BA6